jgi:hypothetical protein
MRFPNQPPCQPSRYTYGQAGRYVPGKRGSMGEIIAELLFRIVAEILFAYVGAWLLDVLGYYTATVVLPVISLGHIYVAPECPTEPSVYARLPDGKIGVHPYAARWIGILIWVLALVLWVFSR